jgi:hypothetical protein
MKGKEETVKERRRDRQGRTRIGQGRLRGTETG